LRKIHRRCVPHTIEPYFHACLVSYMIWTSCPTNLSPRSRCSSSTKSNLRCGGQCSSRSERATREVTITHKSQ
jgi:hypothetical protein